MRVCLILWNLSSGYEGIVVEVVHLEALTSQCMVDVSKDWNTVCVKQEVTTESGACHMAAKVQTGADKMTAEDWPSVNKFTTAIRSGDSWHEEATTDCCGRETSCRILWPRSRGLLGPR